MISAEEIARFFWIGFVSASLFAMPVLVVGLIWQLRHLMK